MIDEAAADPGAEVARDLLGEAGVGVAGQQHHAGLVPGVHPATTSSETKHGLCKLSDNVRTLNASAPITLHKSLYNQLCQLALVAAVWWSRVARESCVTLLLDTETSSGY